MSAPPLSRALCLAYGSGSIGSGVFSTIPGLLLLFYLTDTLAVPAGLAGLAILIPKLWDIVTDPIVGAWSDRTQTRWGRRRPFLLGGALLLPPCFMALFMAPVGDPMVSFFWVLLAFCAAAGAFTLFQVPYACGYLGLMEKKGARPEFKGNAYIDSDEIPVNLGDALDLLDEDAALKEVLRVDFCKVYDSVKRNEYKEFLQVISPWEREHLLLNV